MSGYLRNLRGGSLSSEKLSEVLTLWVFKAVCSFQTLQILLGVQSSALFLLIKTGFGPSQIT